PTMLISLATQRTDAAIFIAHHSDVVRQKVLAQGLRPFERRVYSRAARIIATSPTYASGSRLLRRYAAKVKVLPYGIDLQPYLSPKQDPLKAAARIRAAYAHPLWLACGRLVYYKGLVNALRALPNVPGTLIIVGDGPDRPALEVETDRLELRERVVFLGEIP